VVLCGASNTVVSTRSNMNLRKRFVRVGKNSVRYLKTTHPLCIIEPDTTISMVNDAYCQMSGYTKEELLE